MPGSPPGDPCLPGTDKDEVGGSSPPGVTVTFVGIGWFETEEELNGIQRAFVNVLRAHAQAWPLDPAETCLVLPGYEAYGYPLAPGQSAYGGLLVYVDIPAPGENHILLTVDAYLDGDHVTGDELHNQMLTLPAEPTPIGFEESGSPEMLAARTGHWFATLLHRPIVRGESTVLHFDDQGQVVEHRDYDNHVERRATLRRLVKRSAPGSGRATDPLTGPTEMGRTRRVAGDSSRSGAQVGETGRSPRDHGDVRRGAHNPATTEIPMVARHRRYFWWPDVAWKRNSTTSPSRIT